METTERTKINYGSFIRKPAQAISAFTSPLLVPTYAIYLALWQTSISFAPIQSRLLVLAATFALSCMLPIISIFVLARLGVVKDPLLNDRGDRFYPYTVAAVCYVGLAFFMPTVHAPGWLTAFVWGACALCVFALIINNWWKISGHSMVMGGLTAFCYFMYLRGNFLVSNDFWFYLVVALSGCVMTSRLILNRHSLEQTMAGFALGLIVISISQIL